MMKMMMKRRSGLEWAATILQIRYNKILLEWKKKSILMQKKRLILLV
jgi:hypothetical protein